MKKHLGMLLIMASALLLGIATSYTNTVKAQSAQSATVFIDSIESVDIAVGSFGVKVKVSDVTGLYGWEIKFYFNNRLLQYQKYNLTGGFLESTGYMTFPIDKSDNNYNATHGLIWLADTLVGAPSGVNGNGTLVTVIFKALDTGPVELVFEDMSTTFDGKNVKLGDKSGQPIYNIAIDKTFNIVPEFPSAVLLITVLATASVAILLTKKYKTLK